MNRLFADGAHGKLMLCVLEPGNIHKLVAERKPIELNLNEPPFERGLPAKLTIVLAYSETPVADAKDFKKLLETGARVIDSRSPAIKTKRPHCFECSSTIEQLAVWRSDEAPVWLVFCPMCGCTLGAVPPIDSLRKEHAK